MNGCEDFKDGFALSDCSRFSLLKAFSVISPGAEQMWLLCLLEHLLMLRGGQVGLTALLHGLLAF